MNCKEICELLTAYLDGEVTPQEKAYIESHLSGCMHCRAELEALSATQENVRGMLKSMAEKVSTSVQSWEKVQEQLEKKGSWFDGLCKLLASKTWQVATVTAAVVVIAMVAAIWQFGGVGQTPPVPAPTPTPAPGPAPRPAPPPPFETIVNPEEVVALPGESIDVTLSLTNTSANPMTLELWPPKIRVTPRLDWNDTLLSTAPGTESQVMAPGEKVSLDYTWDQKNFAGEQVLPGWYNILFGEITIRYGNSSTSFTPGSRVLIQYPQGAMENSFDLNQSKTVNDIMVTLERVELTADGSNLYFFFIPLGYTAPPTGPGLEPMPPTMSVMAKAEYSLDGVTKYAGTAGFNTRGDGIKLIWGGGPGKLDPIPSDAQELIFIITQINDWEGPWEFKVPLD